MALNIQRTIREIKREIIEEEDRIKGKVSTALEEVKKLKEDFIKIDPDLEMMILYGSLAEERIRSIHFDIDIAVKSNKYFQLVGRALQSRFKIDLVDLEVVDERIKKSIFKYGRFIYEKLKALNIKLPEISKGFNNCHGHFIQQLRKILGSL